jgi:hypothetical protein
MNGKARLNYVGRVNPERVARFRACCKEGERGNGRYDVFRDADPIKLKKHRGAPNVLVQ